jgi:hypothetical protein
VSRHQLELVIEVDDEKLTNTGWTTLYPKDISEWNAGDIFRAHKIGIIDLEGCEILWYDGIITDEKGV